ATLQAGTHLFNQLNQDSGTLEEFLTQTGTALHALSRNKSDLTNLVTNARRTTQALGSDNQSLSSALRNLPPALRQGSAAFVAVRPALGDLRALIRATDPVSHQLTPFLRDLRPVVHSARPASRDFRLLSARPGSHDDLLDALRDLPTLAKATDQAFPNAEKTLSASTPVLSYIRPYTPDLVGFVRSFAGAAATYDANGHYARTVPVFDAFNFNDNADGGTLTPKDQSEKGKSPYLLSGNLHR